MTPAEVISGVLVLAILVVSAGFAAHRLRVRLLPGWTGARGALVDVVVTLSHLVVVSQLLGTVGLFGAPALLGFTAVTGVAVGLIAGKPAEREQAPSLPRIDRTGAVVGVGAVALVAARWTLPTAETYRTGIIDDDSVAYHMPFAARFAEEGWLSRLHFAVPEIPMAFYPANAELFHALGLLAFGDDLLSPALNLVWLGLLLLSGWCLGRASGTAPAVLVALVVIAGSPLAVSTQAGSAHNDIVGMSMLLAAAALLTAGWSERWAVLVAGLATGLALGVKFTFILPAVALTAGVAVLAWREGRRSLLPVWIGAVLATGGYWYLRNLLRTGSPIPPVELGVGPLALPRTQHTTDSADFAIVDYLDQPRLALDILTRGAFEAFGPLWPVFAVCFLGGLALVLYRPRSEVHRVLALVALISAVGYAFTPATAFGLPGQPQQIYVTANLRYALPALVLGLTLLPLSRALDGARRQRGLMAALGALALSMHTASASIWMAWRRNVPVLPGLVAAALVVVVGTLAARAAVVSNRLWAAGSAVAVVGTLAAVVALGSWYGDHRFTANDSGTERVHAWAQSVEQARIGVVGTFRHYPLYGPEQTNEVQYVGRLGTNQRFRELDDCVDWRRAVNDGSYDFIVAMPGREGEALPEQAAWTRSDPSATEILNHRGASVFRIDGPLTLDCE